MRNDGSQICHSLPARCLCAERFLFRLLRHLIVRLLGSLLGPKIIEGLDLWLCWGICCFLFGPLLPRTVIQSQPIPPSRRLHNQPDSIFEGPIQANATDSLRATLDDIELVKRPMLCKHNLFILPAARTWVPNTWLCARNHEVWAP